MQYRLSQLIFVLVFFVAAQFAEAQGEPWRRPLMICSGSDGTNFGNVRTFQDSAGVPCIIRLPSGVLASAFQWFRQPAGSSTWDRVAVKFSSDNGITWSAPQPIVVNGLPQNFQRPFDPALANTDDGRIRIFFSSGLSLMPDTSVNTYSAVSTDGVNYTMDNGYRFGLPDRPVIDPAVIKFRGLWHLVNPVTMGTGAYHNISGDGLIFTRVQDIVSDQSHSWIGNFMINDTNELRFYGSGAGIWYSSSPNGGQWSSFVSTNIQGGDPAVIRLVESNYIMIYTGQQYPNSVEESGVIVKQFELMQNYPNPFNPSTVIRFYLSGENPARILISDVSGRTVGEIRTRVTSGDFQEVTFVPEGLPSGVYFYSLISEEKILSTRKMLLRK